MVETARLSYGTGRRTFQAAQTLTSILTLTLTITLSLTLMPGNVDTAQPKPCFTEKSPAYKGIEDDADTSDAGVLLQGMGCEPNPNPNSNPDPNHNWVLLQGMGSPVVVSLTPAIAPESPLPGDISGLGSKCPSTV